jgi:hypothetical protein
MVRHSTAHSYITDDAFIVKLANNHVIILHDLHVQQLILLRRLFNYGIGIHLLQAEDPASMPPKKTEINPKDNHVSFQVCRSACHTTSSS